MSVRDRIRRLVRPVTHVDSSDPRWYDQCYRQRPAAYMSPYRDSLYYFLWLELAPRLLTFDHVLEVGCGTGQFAHMLHDLGVQGYTGFDFSCEGVEIASRRLDADFLVADAMTTDLFETVPYDAVVMTEVLEHIPDDVDMLGAHPTRNTRLCHSSRLRLSGSRALLPYTARRPKTLWSRTLRSPGGDVSERTRRSALPPHARSDPEERFVRAIVPRRLGGKCATRAAASGSGTVADSRHACP